MQISCGTHLGGRVVSQVSSITRHRQPQSLRARSCCETVLAKYPIFSWRFLTSCCLFSRLHLPVHLSLRQSWSLRPIPLLEMAQGGQSLLWQRAAVPKRGTNQHVFRPTVDDRHRFDTAVGGALEGRLPKGDASCLVTTLARRRSWDCYLRGEARHTSAGTHLTPHYHDRPDDIRGT